MVCFILLALEEYCLLQVDIEREYYTLWLLSTWLMGWSEVRGGFIGTWVGNQEEIIKVLRYWIESTGTWKGIWSLLSPYFTPLYASGKSG